MGTMGNRRCKLNQFKKHNTSASGQDRKETNRRHIASKTAKCQQRKLGFVRQSQQTTLNANGTASYTTVDDAIRKVGRSG